MKSVLISIRPQWVVYFYEDGIIHSGIYYTEERAKTRLEIENGR